MINPYAGVNWGTFQQIVSISHAHCETQAELNLLYNGGVRHMAISNYHPSKPWYPLEEYFETVPDDIVQCPNAEHWRMSFWGDSQGTSNVHLNGIGSLCQSDFVEPWGTGKPADIVIPEILNGLKYPDGGGISINHPAWSNWYLDRNALPLKRILTLLDFDERILGIEFYNDSSERYQDQRVGWDLETWDDVLITGRRAWGFAVPDHWGQTHAEWRGRNVLLVSGKTEHECLKAYREGRFFGRLKNTDLSFTEISQSDHTITVRTNNAESISYIVDGVKTTVEGSEITITVPTTAVYVRFEAENEDDSIFSNPIIFIPYTQNRYRKSWFQKML